MDGVKLKLPEFLAIYAALLSTIVFAWNILRTIPKFKVDIMFGTYSNDGEIEHGVYIGIRNPSSHTIHLSSVDILYQYKDRKLVDLVSHIFKYRRLPRTVGWVHTSLSNYDLKDGCPLALESGKSYNVFVKVKLHGVKSTLSSCYLFAH